MPGHSPFSVPRYTPLANAGASFLSGALGPLSAFPDPRQGGRAVCGAFLRCGRAWLVLSLLLAPATGLGHGARSEDLPGVFYGPLFQSILSGIPGPLDPGTVGASVRVAALSPPQQLGPRQEHVLACLVLLCYLQDLWCERKGGAWCRRMGAAPCNPRQVPR